MKQIQLTDEEFKKMKDLGIEFEEKPLYEMIIEYKIHDVLDDYERSVDCEQEQIDAIRPRSKEIAYKIFRELFLISDRPNEVTEGAEALHGVVNDAIGDMLGLI